MQMQLSFRAVNGLMNGTACLQCHWHIYNFKTVRPTAEWWRLWSEPFGSGALWRMCVENRIKMSSSSSSSSRRRRRELRVGVHLQHVTEEVECLRLQCSCTLRHRGRQFTDNIDMAKRSYCWWTVADVEPLLPNTLDLELLICIGQRQ